MDPAERALRMRQDSALAAEGGDAPPHAAAGTVHASPPVKLAEAQVVLARALRSAGQGERARELLAVARETYEKVGDHKALARIDALSRR